MNLLPFYTDIISKYLQLLKVNVNTQTITHFLQNHPDFPSLLSISDFLNSLNIPNAAGKTDIDNIESLPTPFLITTKSTIFPFILVEKVEQDTITAYYDNDLKKKNFSKKEFSIIWNDIFLISEPIENSGEINYTKIKQKKVFKNVLLLTSVILSLYFSMNIIKSAIIENNTILPIVNLKGLYVHFFISLIGFIVSIALLWYEIDENNSLLQKVCTSIKKGNCGAILSGKYSKVTSWLSWSEVGFVYFAGNLCVILFAKNIFETITFISWLSLASISYSFFSIYYQWKVLKQWCILCLIIQFTFLANVLNAFLFKYYELPLALNFSFLLNVLLYYTFIFIILTLLKPYIIKLYEHTDIKQRYLRLKFNPKIFNGLLKDSKKIENVPIDLGIILGNPKARNTLIKVSDPYCNPCSKVYPKVEQLIKKNINLKVQIIFFVIDTSQKEALGPVEFFLSIEEKKDQNLLKETLDKWYSDENKNFNLFRKTFDMPEKLLDKQENKVLQMKEWCEKADIQYTPTFFFNGYKLPTEYSVEDLHYFLME